MWLLSVSRPTGDKHFPCTFSIEPMQVDLAVLSTKSTL
jgi:hypothetical protein